MDYANKPGTASTTGTGLTPASIGQDWLTRPYYNLRRRHHSVCARYRVTTSAYEVQLKLASVRPDDFIDVLHSVFRDLFTIFASETRMQGEPECKTRVVFCAPSLGRAINFSSLSLSNIDQSLAQFMHELSNVVQSNAHLLLDPCLDITVFCYHPPPGAPPATAAVEV